MLKRIYIYIYIYITFHHGREQNKPFFRDWPFCLNADEMSHLVFQLQEGLEKRQTIYGDKEKNACFGFAIGNVGDLNKDRNNGEKSC